MHWDDFWKSWQDAKNTIEQADHIASQMVRMLKGRLHTVPGYLLVDLKRELRDFNIQTKKWKS